RAAEEMRGGMEGCQGGRHGRQGYDLAEVLERLQQAAESPADLSGRPNNPRCGSKKNRGRRRDNRGSMPAGLSADGEARVCPPLHFASPSPLGDGAMKLEPLVPPTPSVST